MSINTYLLKAKLHLHMDKNGQNKALKSSYYEFASNYHTHYSLLQLITNLSSTRMYGN